MARGVGGSKYDSKRSGHSSFPPLKRTSPSPGVGRSLGARSGRVGSRTPGSQQEQHAQGRATRRLFTSSAEAEDHDSAEADDEDSAESGAPPDLEAGMHELHAELGKDWILRFLSRATTLR
jgi:hypothetical protein